MQRRRILQLIGIGSAVGLSGCAGLAQQYEGGSDGSNSSGSTTGEPTRTRQGGSDGGSDQTPQDASPEYPVRTPDGPVVGARTPPNPSNYPYATMGAGNAPVNVEFFGSWKCPFTREFVRQRFGDIVERYVQPGDVQITFRALAYQNGEPFLGQDAPRATRAGLAVWNADPQSFWEYFATVFASQPPERAAWATEEQLVAFVEAAGVDGVERVRSEIASNERSSRVRATTSAAADRGIDTIPRLVIDGEVYAPNLEWEAVLDALDDAVREA